MKCTLLSFTSPFHGARGVTAQHDFKTIKHNFKEIAMLQTHVNFISGHTCMYTDVCVCGIPEQQRKALNTLQQAEQAENTLHERLPVKITPISNAAYYQII